MIVICPGSCTMRREDRSPSSQLCLSTCLSQETTKDQRTSRGRHSPCGNSSFSVHMLSRFLLPIKDNLENREKHLKKIKVICDFHGLLSFTR